jgi:hypothetical protein
MSRFGGGEADQPWVGLGLRNNFTSNGERFQTFRPGRPWVGPKHWFVSSLLGDVITWMTDPLCNRIPEGYEDERGFHYGCPPAQNADC